MAKKWYGFTNDNIFGSIMENKEYCKAVIEAVVPDLKIETISSIETQKTLGTKTDMTSKDVRLDVAVTDDKGRIYDVEMQVSNNHNIGKRSRYYQSSMDRYTLDKGEPYTELSQTYIIFLCPFDPYGYGDGIYTFHLYSDKHRELKQASGSNLIVVNSKGKIKNDKQKALFSLMNDDKIEIEGIFEEIRQTIEGYNKDPKRRALMRTAELRLKEEMAVARLEGIEQGIEQGSKKTRAEEQKKTVKSMYKGYKTFKPGATVEEAIPWIRANTEVSLSDKEIEDILKEEK